MRCAGARAAALLLTLVLGTTGCDLVSSLTPFGIGTQDYTSENQNLNGGWAGKTASGGDVTFLVGDAVVIELLLYHQTSEPGCDYVSFESTTATAPIVDGAFTLEMNLENYGQGHFVISGRCTSSNTCTGNYVFEGRPAGVCPTAGNGTFSATRIF